MHRKKLPNLPNDEHVQLIVFDSGRLTSYGVTFRSVVCRVDTSESEVVAPCLLHGSLGLDTERSTEIGRGRGEEGKKVVGPNELHGCAECRLQTSHRSSTATGL